MRGALPQGDAFHAIHRDAAADRADDRRRPHRPQRQRRLLPRQPRGGGKAREAIDLKTGEYRPAAASRSSTASTPARASLRALLAHAEQAGAVCAGACSAQTLAYAASLVPEIADDIVAIDEAMRLGYNWQFGPFELIDKIGAGLARRPARDAQAARCRRCCKTAAGRTFYRIEDGRAAVPRPRWQLPRPVQRAAACCCSRTSSSLASRSLKNGSAALWDIGDGVALPRIHLQDERARRRHPRAVRQVDRAGRTAYQGAGHLQRGQQFLGRRQSRPRAVCRQRRAWAAIETAHRRRAEGLQGAEIRALPRRRRARRHGARRRLRDPAALRRRPGACRDLYGPRRGRRRR